MKKIGSTLLGLLLTLVTYSQNESGVEFTHGTWEEVKALAKQENKSIFIDCYTVWCGPCKMLSKDIFPQEEVGRIFNQHFINYKVDMEKGEGILLKEKFKVAAFPTLVWVDANGDELHKSVGAPKADELIAIAQLVIDGKGLADLERQYTSTPDDTVLMSTYLKALANAYEKAKIQEVLAPYFKKNKGKKLLEDYNYQLIKTYLQDVQSPAFTWFDKHQQAFIAKYGEEEVKQKLYQSYLSYGHAFVSRKKGETVVDHEGFSDYTKLLNKRAVEGREKIVAFVKENIFRSTNQWDDFISKVKSNIELGYHGKPNSFLYYNWAKAIEKGKGAEIKHYQQAATWLEDAFKASQWPLQHNIVYLNEKLNLLELAKTDDETFEAEKKRVDAFKQQVKETSNSK